jgi:signal transduction histidine kinase
MGPGRPMPEEMWAEVGSPALLSPAIQPPPSHSWPLAGPGTILQMSSRTTSSTAMASSHELVFRPRARLVSILGEHLISDHAVGLIELVKNSYDADATEVTVEILHPGDPEKTTVVILDNGFGMTIDDIREKWLSPAIDHKEQEKRASRRTPLGRLPIGEKGVGRFAVHQLGRRLEMVTRAKNQPEVVVVADWDGFDRSDRFLEEVPVNVLERAPVMFTGDQTGTRVEVTTTRIPWTDKLLKKVHRTLRRLQSPLVEDKHRFAIRLKCPDVPEIESIDPTDLLPKAHYDFSALVQHDGKCDLEYACRHPSVVHRQQAQEGLDLVPLAGDELVTPTPRCGSFWLNIYVWDRSRDYLQASGVAKKELDALCGVSLFRDGLRVLPYGEPGDDWLLLDQERIQAPAERIGNNQVIGLVQFDQSSNLQLRDKTNREGLIENEAFLDLRALVRAALRQFTKYWKNDRPPAREARKPDTTGTIDGARVVATALQQTARPDVEVTIPSSGIPNATENGDHSQPNDAGSSGEHIVSQQRAVQLMIRHIDGTAETIRARDEKFDTLLQLSGTGLAAERVVHEFGRQVLGATEAIAKLREARTTETRDKAITRIESALEALRSEFRILAPYEMTGPPQRTRLVGMREMANLAIDLNRSLIADGKIKVRIEGNDWQERIKATPLLQVLDNLIHNACFWTATVAEGQRHVGVLLQEKSNRILVADTGPGVDVEVVPRIFEPFSTMKAGGKGLGLYISAELAKGIGGRLRLIEQFERTSLPSWTGAVFALELKHSTGEKGRKNG